MSEGLQSEAHDFPPTYRLQPVVVQSAPFKVRHIVWNRLHPSGFVADRELGCSTGKAIYGQWHCACSRMTETQNFRIHSFGSHKLNPQVAVQCEAVRLASRRAWFPTDQDQPWTPKCTLVLHGTRAGYRSVVGRLAACTVASCTIQVVGEATTERRIDVSRTNPVVSITCRTSLHTHWLPVA